MMIVEGAGGVVVVVIVAGLKLEVIDDEICEIVGGTVFFSLTSTDAQSSQLTFSSVWLKDFS